eukprot:216375-Rhodomonas_salina.1
MWAQTKRELALAKEEGGRLERRVRVLEGEIAEAEALTAQLNAIVEQQQSLDGVILDEILPGAAMKFKPSGADGLQPGGHMILFKPGGWVQASLLARHRKASQALKGQCQTLQSDPYHAHANQSPYLEPTQRDLEPTARWANRPSRSGLGARDSDAGLDTSSAGTGRSSCTSIQTQTQVGSERSMARGQTSGWTGNAQTEKHARDVASFGLGAADDQRGREADLRLEEQEGDVGEIFPESSAKEGWNAERERELRLGAREPERGLGRMNVPRVWTPQDREGSGYGPSPRDASGEGRRVGREGLGDHRGGRAARTEIGDWEGGVGWRVLNNLGEETHHASCTLSRGAGREETKDAGREG